jgi:hypothetical protein
MTIDMDYINDFFDEKLHEEIAKKQQDYNIHASKKGCPFSVFKTCLRVWYPKKFKNYDEDQWIFDYESFTACFYTTETQLHEWAESYYQEKIVS